MIRVVVADDQALIRQALARLLDLEPDLTVVGEAGTVDDVVAVAVQTVPDVVVVDVQMPGGSTAADGIDATAVIRERVPGARVIIVTTFGRPGYLQRAMAAGASGFMVKDAPADQLVDGIRRVAQGLRVVDPELAVNSLAVGPSPLTEREAEVLTRAARGGSTAAIAASVFLSEGTVRNHLSAAMAKLGAANRAEAIRVATDHGWIT